MWWENAVESERADRGAAPAATSTADLRRRVAWVNLRLPNRPLKHTPPPRLPSPSAPACGTGGHTRQELQQLHGVVLAVVARHAVHAAPPPVPLLDGPEGEVGPGGEPAQTGAGPCRAAPPPARLGGGADAERWTRDTTGEHTPPLAIGGNPNAKVPESCRTKRHRSPCSIWSSTWKVPVGDPPHHPPGHRPWKTSSGGIPLQPCLLLPPPHRIPMAAPKQSVPGWCLTPGPPSGWDWSGRHRHALDPPGGEAQPVRGRPLPRVAALHVAPAEAFVESVPRKILSGFTPKRKKHAESPCGEDEPEKKKSLSPSLGGTSGRGATWGGTQRCGTSGCEGGDT